MERKIREYASESESRVLVKEIVAEDEVVKEIVKKNRERVG